jgi:hypothetical protein
LGLARDNAERIIGNVAQVTIYLPDALARRLRREARRARTSLSAYVAQLAGRRPPSERWPEWFLGLQGSCGGSLAIPDDPAPEEPARS